MAGQTMIRQIMIGQTMAAQETKTCFPTNDENS
jgi:hypothetical protein